MIASEKEKAGTDELRSRLVAALRHPLRAPILTILSERSASAGEIAVELGVSVESAGHQLRRLRRDGLVQPVEKKRRRGVAENYYRSTLDPFLGDEDFAALPSEQRCRISAQVIKRLSVDARRAYRAGSVGSPNNICPAHIRMVLDERGWRELAEIHREAFDRVVALRRCVAERIKGSSETGAPAAITLLCFELPTLAVHPIDE
jgi:DNA-binding transcriptional ArsR family regulator